MTARLDALVAKGIDPVAHKRETKASATTFSQAAEQWITTHAPSWRSASQMKNARLLLHVHGKPLADMPVNRITPADIEGALKEEWTAHPAQGRRALAMFERVFDFAKAHGWRTGDNPASWRGCQEYRWPKRQRGSKPHFEAMSYAELPDFVRELRRRQARSTAASALEFLILTAARTGEALKAKWSEFDLDKKLWTLPPERTKQNREHAIPLCDRAIELLALQRQYSNGSEFVFTGYRPTALSEKTMLLLLKDMGHPCTVHGFRSSFRDYMGNETNFAREPVEQCLAHQVGNQVELAYWRSDALAKRRVIMDHWASFCGGDWPNKDYQK
jgi:integrase